MARYTLLAYVEGFDLAGVADDLDARFRRFVAGRQWKSPGVRVVNQRQAPDPSLQPGDLPQWDLGLNLDLPDPGARTPGWFDDVEAVVAFLTGLRAATGRDFVIAVHDGDAGFNEDLLFVDSETPDVAGLRAMLG